MYVYLYVYVYVCISEDGYSPVDWPLMSTSSNNCPEMDCICAVKGKVHLRFKCITEQKLANSCALNT